jgi:uncharacterized protein
LTKQALPAGSSDFQRVAATPLPIFLAQANEAFTFFTPRQVCVLDRHAGLAAAAHVERLAAEASQRDVPHDLPTELPDDGALRAAWRIVAAARDVVREATDLARLEFAPECLTIYASNRCNLHCGYCYSRPQATAQTVSAAAVHAAARLIARTCAERNRPFTLAFHGGGEPTLERRHLDALLALVRSEANRHDVRLHTYIATNGAVPERTAQWLAAEFDLVGVSCDGPPDIHDRQRPNRKGQPSAASVYRTMDILRRHDRPFHVRTTVTRDTVDRQAELVTFLGDRFAPTEIRIEPVYANGAGEPALDVRQATAFVDGFLGAQAVGAAQGIPVTTSITRPDVLYGPYCNVLRNVITLVPGDVATGCFLDSSAETVARCGTRTGTYDARHDVFQLQTEHIQSLITRCSTIPAGCENCLCGHQCTFGCPDRCQLEAPATDGQQIRETFRCTTNRLLTERMIREAAERAWMSTSPGNYREDMDTPSGLCVAVYRERVDQALMI